MLTVIPPASPTSTSAGAPAPPTAAAAPPPPQRSPLLRRQPSVPTPLPHPPPHHISPSSSFSQQQQQQQQASFPPIPSPRLPPPGNGPPSVTSVGTSSIYRTTRHSNRLRAPLRRLSSYNQADQGYSSDDEDVDSAAEADIETVQAELDRSWDGYHPITSASAGTVRQRRRVSAGPNPAVGAARGKASHRTIGRQVDDDACDTSTVRRQHGPAYHSRDTDNDDNPHDEDRPQSRINRHDDDEDADTTDSDGVPDSEASYTLKDRQDAINITHPFGLKIWKPALYKKDRSVQRIAEGEIHSRPGQWPDRKIRIGNVLWTLLFGWWIGLVTTVMAVLLFMATWWSGGHPYARVLFGLAKYLVYPFGRFVELTPDEAYAEEDEGEGRSISEYERYGAVDIERGRQLGIFSSSPASDNRRGLIGRRRDRSIESWGDYSERDSLLGGEPDHTRHEAEETSGSGGRKRRFFGRGQWTAGRILFYICFYLVIGKLQQTSF